MATNDHNSGTLETTIAKAFTVDNVAGNMLFAVCGSYGANSIDHIADSQGNTWVALPLMAGASSRVCQAFYCLSCKAGANTVTVYYTSTGMSYDQLSIMEFNNVNTCEAHAESTSTAPSVVPTKSNNLVIAYIEDTAAFSSGWTPTLVGSRATIQFKPNQVAETYTHPSASGACLGIVSFYLKSSTGIPNSLMLMGCGT